MRLQSIILIIQATDWYVVRRAPRRGTASVTGQAYGTHTHTHTHTHDNRRRKRKKKKHNFGSWSFFFFCFVLFNMCANMPPPHQHTHQTKKQCWCDARWCCYTELISCLKNFKWGFFVLLFLIHKHVAVCASADPPGARVHIETNTDNCAPSIQTSAHC